MGKVSQYCKHIKNDTFSELKHLIINSNWVCCLFHYILNPTAYTYSPPFPSHKDLHITKHTDQLIKILNDKRIPLDRVIEVLKEQLAVEQVAKLKALAKEKGKEKAREKRQLTDSSSELFMPTHDLNNTRIDVMNLCKVVVKNQISHSTLKTNIFDIVFATSHWTLPLATGIRPNWTT